MNLNRLWRQFATGLCFAVFGLGGLVLSLALLPAPWLVRDRERRERAVKFLIHRCFRLFVGLMKGVGILSYEVTQTQKLREPGQLVVANHPTLIDVVFLIAFIPQADCVVKSNLLRNFFTRGPLSAGGYIANDDPEAVIKAAGASMARGNSLIIFPEGTRTTPGQFLSLQRGAANIAIRTGHDMRPVIIGCNPPTLMKHTKWYGVPERRFHMSFRVNDPISVSDYLKGLPSSASRQLTAELAEYFTRETSCNA